ncbi:MAG TPA: CHAT domain-containing tetratricopeptide repeat protein [Blastocatellia bacterium]|nr:CHAT domain-containing tetratricopeptide repeat protein [Blastocatellia bacterium]
MYTEKLRWLPVIFCILSVVVQAQEAKLEPGQSVTREIAGGEAHTYQITLTAGQFVRFRLEQQAMDGALILTAPDGKPIVAMNLIEVGEQELLIWEAQMSGNYGLTVRGESAATMRGSYRLEASVPGAATPPDRQRLSALRLLVEGKELRAQKAKTARQVIEKGQQALTLLRDLDEPAWAAYAHYLIGSAHSRLNEFDKAIPVFEQGLAICRNAGLRAREGQLLNNLGLTYHWMNQHAKAIPLYEQALTIARALKDRPTEGNYLNNIAAAYEFLRQFDKAIAFYEQALAIALEVKDRESEGNIQNSLGIAYIQLSQYDRAIAHYEKSLAIRRELKDRLQEGTNLNNLGGVYRMKGEYEKASGYYEQSLVIAREVQDRSEEAYALNSLGALYRSLNRYDKAIEYYEQCLLIRQEIKDRRGEGTVLSNLGVAYRSLHQYEKAIALFEQSLAARREVNDRKGEGYTFNNLGSAYTGLKQYEKGIAYSEQSLAIFRAVKDRAWEGYSLHNLAVAYGALRQFEKAIPFGEEALAIAHEIKAWDDELQALATLARLESERGNLEQSRARSESSLKVAELLRAKVISPESRAALLTAVQSSYQLYTDVLMRQHQAAPTKGFDALALAISERQRARNLLDLLTKSRTDLRQGVDKPLLDREQALTKQLNDKAQTKTKTAAEEAALQREISQLEIDLERAQTAIRQASPHYAALMQPQPLMLAAIQQQLDADTLLLEYSLGKERSYLWAITKDSLTSHELPKEEVIEQSARQAYELLTARSRTKRGETAAQQQARFAQAETQLATAAQALSQMLLAPVATQLGNKRLVIVADGALQYVPFAALPEPVVSSQLPVAGKTAAANRQPTTDNRQPLIIKHEIISLPSASALAIQRNELAGRQPAPKLLAVIADPVFERTDTRFAKAMPDNNDEVQTRSFDDERSIVHLAEKSDDPKAKTRQLVIPRLPFTRQEATRLLALAPKTESFSALDFQANRAAVLNSALSQYRYVHFATHGVLDSERPGLSSLLLSMVDESGKPQDGFLRANNIYNLNLPAELVVLSACQTGLGKEIKGEGLVGLTRGFMYAGAARVVVSLWNVNDQATAGLMAKFYRRMLKQGERPAAALRAAQVEMWKQKQWNAPFYWAAFTLQGEWR